LGKEKVWQNKGPGNPLTREAEVVSGARAKREG